MIDEITAWLNALDLGQYSNSFKAHHIKLTLLSQLTHETLIELGVLSLGHRLTLLKAIEDLPKTDVSPTSLPASTPVADLMTERRQLTVMFCDLVNSTGLAARLDAEDLRYIITAYQRAAEPVVTRYGGHIAQSVVPAIPPVLVVNNDYARSAID